MDTQDPHFYRQVIDNLEEGVYFVDRDRKITYWNAGAERLTGYSSEEVVGQTCCRNILGHVTNTNDNVCGDGCPLVGAISAGKTTASAVYLRHKQGHRVAVRSKVTPVRDPDGQVVGAVQSFSDNRMRLAARRRINELKRDALLDPLTGLANRRMGQRELLHRLDELARYGWGFGVLFVDVDNFKAVNDRWGHDVGDDVLKMVARDLVASTRETDQVCRWGGEEFLIMALNVDENQLDYIANKLRYLVEHSGFEREGHDVRVTVSVGATMAQPGESAEALVKRADALMYHSKRSGRNRVSTRLPAASGPRPGTG